MFDAGNRATRTLRSAARDEADRRAAENVLPRLVLAVAVLAGVVARLATYAFC